MRMVNRTLGRSDLIGRGIGAIWDGDNQFGGSDDDAIAVVQPLLGDLVPVYPSAVRGVQVNDGKNIVVSVDAGVCPADPSVFEQDVCVGRAPDDRLARNKQDFFPFFQYRL